jgi:hypothetical protein
MPGKYLLDTNAVIAVLEERATLERRHRIGVEVILHSARGGFDRRAARMAVSQSKALFPVKVST